jgi:hypothetical protein
MERKTMATEGCCGGIPDRMTIIMNASKMLYNAHRQLGEMYRSIARDMKDGSEKEAFEAAAKNQDRLADESAMVTTLDTDGENDGQVQGNEGSEVLGVARPDGTPR